MMKFSKFIPTAVALILFWVVSAVYFFPELKGEVLPQYDMTQHSGMAEEIHDHKRATGEDPQWTGSMFSGMPSYLISIEYPSRVIYNSFTKIADVNSPIWALFLSMLIMWIALLIMGVNPWVGIVSALAYGLSTYSLLILSAGHISKVWALIYAPLMVAGVWYTLRQNMWTGAAITALATSLEIGTNHPQITYYFAMAMGAMWLSELYFSYKGKALKSFAKRTALLLLAGGLAIGSNFSQLWYTMQHSSETTRGGSELIAEGSAGAQGSGLDLEYATAWSYGIDESLNMLIPDFQGRQSATTFSSDGAVAEALTKSRFPAEVAEQLPAYWGDQPYTGGPTYIGAVIILLAALGVALSSNRERWWLIAISIVMIMLAWGYHFMPLTELAFKILPGYNKFRAVSTALVVVQWSVPLLGAFALMKLWRAQLSEQKIRKGLMWAVGTTAGLCLLLMLAGGAIFGFGQDQSAEMIVQQFYPVYVNAGFTAEQAAAQVEVLSVELSQAMAQERASMMSSDALRSLIFILLAGACVWLYSKQKIKRGVLVGALAVLVLADLVPVDRRFISEENFTSPRTTQITPSPADKAIMEDTDPGYRVLNATVSTFNDATTSYFHRSIGGYHGAKLSRYQDLIDNYMQLGGERWGVSPQVLDMLNVRYVIEPSEQGQKVVRRPSANGAAWFVNRIIPATSAQQEIELLGDIDTKTTAVTGKNYTAQGALPSDDFQGVISLVEYTPNYLKYEYSASQSTPIIFSEVFYDKGWQAFIDGEAVPYFRADYILRGVWAPQGEHTIEWRFKAPNWGAIEGVAWACSIIIILALGASIYVSTRNRKENEEN